MDLVTGYDSHSEHEESSAERGGSEITSDSSGVSSEDSLDSAGLRAAEADRLLRDHEVGVHKADGALLPSALAAFSEVDGPPAFLNPEATRPLATSHHHRQGGGDIQEGPTHTGRGQRSHQGQDFDISTLAPPLKGQNRAGGRPSGAVIEARPKRLREEDGAAPGPLYSDAQVAMMGGEVKERQATQSMPVMDFLDKGVGGAQLPRRTQDRKEKEKKKRQLGQSSHSQWKSEAEMVLRQQFD